MCRGARYAGIVPYDRQQGWHQNRSLLPKIFHNIRWANVRADRGGDSQKRMFPNDFC
jgi:hypothetical protein